MTEVTLVIPAYNEQDRLYGTLAIYHDAFRRRFGDDFEIVVVANGCVDGTVRVAAEAAGFWSEIRVVDIKEAIGKGGAVLEGFRQASGERVVFADADGATSPRSLLRLVDQLDRHDVVIGSRRLGGSVITRPQPLTRRAFGLAFAKTARLLFKMPFKDTQCGAKAFRRAAAKRLALVVSETRWTFDLDLLISARKLGFDVYEHPVEWADKDGSRLRYGSTSSEVLQALWQMRLRQDKPLVELPEPPVLGLEAEREPAVQEVVA